MNKQARACARDALAIIRAVNRKDSELVGEIIDYMTVRECAQTAIQLASLAVIWGELLVDRTEGTVEELVDTYIAALL